MESGLRVDTKGRAIAPNFITEVNVSLNEKPLLGAYLGPGLAANPSLVFTMKATKAGDKLDVVWTDSAGEQRSANTVIG